MKKTILTVTLLTLVFSFALAQKTKPIRQVQVTTQTIAGQPTGKLYTIDLTRSGATYNLAAGIDYNRITVHTTKGEMTMAKLLEKTGKNLRGKLRVGLTSDIRTLQLGLSRVSAGGRSYSCEGLVCHCSGEDDCIALFDTTKCGPIAVCYPDGCVCIRL